MFAAFGNLLSAVRRLCGPLGPADPVGYQGQSGAYTDPRNGLVLMGHRYYDPGTGRFLTRDPIGYDGGINLYTYCDGDPVNNADPEGLQTAGPAPNGGPGWDWLIDPTRDVLGYVFSLSYTHDVGEMLKGEASALNPVDWCKGLAAAGSEIKDKGWEGVKNVASSVWKGLQFWNQPDMRSTGASVMGDLLLAAPLIKKIPNPTGIKIIGPYPLAGGGFTAIAIERDVAPALVNQKSKNLLRVECAPLPTVGNRAAKLPAALCGKTLPHVHHPGPGGVGRHRPWEAGPGGLLGRF